MSINQALSAALAGVNATQQAPVGDRRQRGERQHARLRRREPSVRSRSRSPARPAPASTSTGINRDLNTLLQSQLWTETSGGSYADTTAQLYQQLQQIYGTPGSSTSFDAIFNNFTSALQSAVDQPELVFGAERRGQRRAERGAKSQFDDGDDPAIAHPGRAGHRKRRADRQHRAAADRPDQSAAGRGDLRQRHGHARGPARSGHHAALAADERHGERKARTIRFRFSPATASSWWPATQASQLTFNNVGTLSATSQWSADPSQDSAGTITLTSPSGGTTDLIATNAIQSGQIGAYLQMRDTILPQAQTQLDEMANQMSQALSNQTRGHRRDRRIAGRVQRRTSAACCPATRYSSLTPTRSNAAAHRHSRRARRRRHVAGPAGQCDQSGDRGQFLRRHERGGVAAQCRAWHQPAILQSIRHGPAGAQQRHRQCRQFAVGDIDGDVADQRQRATAAVYRRRRSRSPARSRPAARRPRVLPAKSQVNAALVASPSSIVAYAANTASGDPTRPNFLVNQMSQATLTYSPATGLGTAASPFSGTLSQYMSAVVSQQSQAANAATQSAAGPGYGPHRLATALQRPVRRQYRHRNVESDRAAERLWRQCAGDERRSSR